MPSNETTSITTLLTDIRDLLLLIAEPAIAKRDSGLRASIREAVGTGVKRQAASLLMNGKLTRKEIQAQSTIDQSGISRLVSELIEKGLALEEDSRPCLVCQLPSDFYKAEEKS